MEASHGMERWREGRGGRSREAGRLGRRGHVGEGTCKAESTDVGMNAIDREEAVRSKERRPEARWRGREGRRMLAAKGPAGGSKAGAGLAQTR